jgi:hypothetical protein
MIMITRRRDYYDYLQGFFGRDEKKVLNRYIDLESREIHFSDFPKNKPHLNTNIFKIHVCSRLYAVEQVEDGVWEFHKFHKVNKNYGGEPQHKKLSDVEWDSNYTYYTYSDYNLKNLSVVSIEGYYHHRYEDKPYFPILGGFGFPKILPAQELYSEIDMWLGLLMSNKEKSEELSDGEKLLANGFHNPTSFRHRK